MFFVSGERLVRLMGLILAVIGTQMFITGVHAAREHSNHRCMAVEYLQPGEFFPQHHDSGVHAGLRVNWPVFPKVLP
jgi:hypothetical protein